MSSCEGEWAQRQTRSTGGSRDAAALDWGYCSLVLLDRKCGGGVRLARQVDHEHAARSGVVADMDIPVVCAGCSECDSEPQPKSRLVGMPLSKRTEQVLRLIGRQSATFVGNFDENPSFGDARRERNMSMSSAELECVLKQVRDRRCEQMPVAVDHQVAIDGMYR